jgi:transcriptional regulator with PAS, ATPase and Fis domain
MEIEEKLPKLKAAGLAKRLEDFVDLNMVGASPPFVHVLKHIKKIARCDAAVLIEGETGTGKEMAARAIHYLSDRRGFPFIPVNCGAIPDNLLENELFGHERGAYTDAKNAQDGLVWQADRGTIFFDEVETFSPKGQFVLLRFLEDLIFKPLGSEKLRKADVRIMAASNTKLRDLVNQGAFRKDLFYRLDIMSIELPQLSRRTGDIELLAEYFLNKYRLQYNQPDKKLSPEMKQWMISYSWPGNVRELENFIHREFLYEDGPVINICQRISQPEERRINGPDRRQKLFLDCSLSEAKKKMIDQFEKKYLTRLIREVDGNVTKAAKLAGKERRTLGKLLKKHNIRKDGTIIPN